MGARHLLEVVRVVLRDEWEDVALLQTLRSGVFRQMLEPPAWRDGARTVVEGRPRVGAEHRLQSLGFVAVVEGRPLSTDRKSFGASSKKETLAPACPRQ